MVRLEILEKQLKKLVGYDKVVDGPLIVFQGMDEGGIYEILGKGFGVVADDGEICFTKTFYKNIMALNQHVCLVSSFDNKFGAFDIHEKRFIVDCKYDFMEYFSSQGDLKSVGFYLGANCYVLTVRGKVSSFSIYPKLTFHQLSALEKHPEYFLTLDRAYFSDENGNYSSKNVMTLLESTTKGIFGVLRELKKDPNKQKEYDDFLLVKKAVLEKGIDEKMVRERNIIKNFAANKKIDGKNEILKHCMKTSQKVDRKKD